MITSRSRFNYAVRIRRRDTTGALVEPEHFDVCPRVTKTNYTDNTDYFTTEGDRWSRIAWQKIGTGKHWWLLADFSDVIDPFSELKPKEKAFYATQLQADVSGTLSSVVLVSVRDVKKGTKLRLEDLNPAHNVYVDVYVQSVDVASRTIYFNTLTAMPSGGIPALLSRVSILSLVPVRLVVPSANTANFDALDFSRSVNIMED